MSALGLARPAVRPGVALARLGLSAPVPAAVHRTVARAVGTIAARAAGVRAEPAPGGEWLRADDRSDAVVLYLHGGGYAVGDVAVYRVMLARLAVASGCDVFALDYRQAPEHPYPAALEDARDAYDRLAADHRTVLVAGDSAGGGLALGLAQQLRDEGAAAPAALGLVCPWLDLTRGGATQRAARDRLLSPRTLERWARWYAAADRAAASPLYGDLAGLPPIVLHSVGDDLLRADAERLELLAREAGADLVHHRIPGGWHDLHLFAGIRPDADAAVDQLGEGLRRRLPGERRPARVAIVGAGVSGLAMAHALRRRGHDDFTVFEKAGEVGGTWRENRYPGLTCDVPSNLYSFTFALNPGWTSSFAAGAEIQAYMVDVADRERLRPHVRFDSEVVSAAWTDDHWRLETADGRTHDAEVLVTATGILHHPRVPDLPGLADFAGIAMHSARWDDDLDLADKRVGVIGTGSTGVQLVSALGGTTRSLRLFQRTPQWVVPVPNLPYPAPLRLALRIPGVQRRAYRVYQRQLEGLLGPAVARDGWQRKLLTRGCELNLRFAVRDPDLRARLTPDDLPLCKRLVMSATFYPALQRPGVALVDAAIERVVPEGIVTADGVLHELDVLVLATGFDAHAYMRPMRLTGRAGLDLDDAWADGPRGYGTVALPGFPNLFTLMGPHSPVGNHSITAVAETQADYIAQCVDAIEAHGPLEPTAAAADAFNDAMRAALPNTIWATGCASWYLGADGLPELWPWSPARHRELLAAPDLDAYAAA